MWPLVVCIVILCILSVYLQFQRPQDPSPPVYPGELPVIGHTHLLLSVNQKNLFNFLKTLSDQCRNMGGIITFKYLSQKLYVITDPDDFQTVSNTCFGKPYLYDFGKEWVGSGLVTADAKKWKIHRKLIQPSFGPQVLNEFLSELNNQARNLANDLVMQSGKGPFNPERKIIDNLLETVCLTTLQLTTKDVVGKEYVHAIEKLVDMGIQRILTFWLHINFIYNWSSLKKQFEDQVKVSAAISLDAIRKRKLILMENKTNNAMENVDTNAGKYKPLLDRLLDLSAERNVFTDREMREHLDTLIIASYDTTYRAVMFTLIMIGSYVEVQEKMYKELQEVFGNKEKNMDVERQDLAKLVYMEAVIKETLRLYPIAPAIARYTDKRVKLKNYTLQAGQMCILSIYGVNRHPIWGPEADKFIPERWFDQTTFPQNANAYAAFSLGQRNCIGKRYAIMLIKIMLVHLLRRYRVTSDASRLVLEQDLLLKPASGQEISLELRN